MDALPVMVREPLTEPLPVGLKRTEIAQLFFGRTDPPHALVWVKARSIAIPAILRVALPVLLSVTVLLELVLPTACLPKLRLDGLTVAIAAGVGGMGLGLLTRVAACQSRSRPPSGAAKKPAGYKPCRRRPVWFTSRIEIRDCKTNIPVHTE